MRPVDQNLVRAVLREIYPGVRLKSGKRRVYRNDAKACVPFSISWPPNAALKVEHLKDLNRECSGDDDPLVLHAHPDLKPGRTSWFVCKVRTGRSIDPGQPAPPAAGPPGEERGKEEKEKNAPSAFLLTAC